MRWFLAPVIPFVFALTVAAQETEIRPGVVVATAGSEDATASLIEEQDLRARWRGRSREEVLAAWGTPCKIKHRKGMEVLIYKHLFFCGFVIDSSPDIDCQPEPDPAVKWDKTKVTFLFDSEGQVQDLQLSIPSSKAQKKCLGLGGDLPAER